MKDQAIAPRIYRFDQFWAECWLATFIPLHHPLNDMWRLRRHGDDITMLWPHLSRAKMETLCWKFNFSHKETSIEASRAHIPPHPIIRLLNFIRKSCTKFDGSVIDKLWEMLRTKWFCHYHRLSYVSMETIKMEIWNWVKPKKGISRDHMQQVDKVWGT